MTDTERPYSIEGDAVPTDTTVELEKVISKKEETNEDSNPGTSNDSPEASKQE